MKIDHAQGVIESLTVFLRRFLSVASAEWGHRKERPGDIAMTLPEWLACANPEPMLQFLGDRASERKLRLFTVACCRRIWPLITEAQCRAAVEVAEQFADGLVTSEVREAAHLAAERVRQQVEATEAPLFSGVAYATAYAACYTVHAKGTAWLACRTAVSAACAAGHALSSQGATEGEVAAAFDAEGAAQAAFVRDIFGNPFSPVTLDPAWRVWQAGTIPQLAQAIYNERAIGRLSALADALEKAGCGNTDLLAHCRETGPHVKGCWVVDLILGRD